MTLTRYLVGGAVRDRLLGLVPHEQDWVVVGATPEQMTSAGYRQVGRDFPVFLHPQTSEEHALARTERKSGAGHQGFVVHADPEVRLEDDLVRRDLTVNAIAQDETGALIDPHGGLADLEARWLRHVSPAFAEDPLRILRLARFAARFAPLGFRVAEPTVVLCRAMIADGALRELSAERVWKETARALMESPQPSIFFETLRALGGLEDWFPELGKLFGVPQRPEYHPEVDTGLHTMLCIDHAAEQGYPLEVRYSALVHDLGKGTTPREQWPRHIQHEARGVPLVRRFGERLRVPNRCQDLAIIHTREHLLVHQALQLRPATLLGLLERLQAFRRSGDVFERLCEACYCDARGRTGLERSAYPQVPFLQQARAVASALGARDVMGNGLEGPAITEALTKARVEALARWRPSIPSNG